MIQYKRHIVMAEHPKARINGDIVLNGILIIEFVSVIEDSVLIFAILQIMGRVRPSV